MPGPDRQERTQRPIILVGDPASLQEDGNQNYSKSTFEIIKKKKKINLLKKKKFNLLKKKINLKKKNLICFKKKLN